MFVTYPIFVTVTLLNLFEFPNIQYSIYNQNYIQQEYKVSARTSKKYVHLVARSGIAHGVGFLWERSKINQSCRQSYSELEMCERKIMI